MKPEDYPFRLTAKDVQDIMRCSKNKVYEIIHRADFPKLTEGRSIFIPRDAFFRWFDNVGGVGAGVNRPEAVGTKRIAE